MQINKILKYAAALLSEAGVESPFLDARLLLKFCFNYSEEDLLRNYDQDLTPEQEKLYFSFIRRRESHEPIAYIIGFREFFGRNFIVNKNVLIPRPDSETIIEAVLTRFSDLKKSLRIIDIGTGSGCLLITLLMEYQNSTAIGIDVSEAALEVAWQNIDYYDLRARAELQQSYLLNNITIEQFDVIICNPPYIDKADTHHMNQATEFEPEIALFAKNNGLLIYEEISAQISNYMNNKTLAFFEIGFNQKNQVVKIFEKNNLYIEEIANDLSGTPRCIIVRK
jgi:release factor glutamine methyltransferase